MEKRIINVVCVSKKISGHGYRHSLQHLNIAGPALLDEKKGTIEFLGESYSIISTRTGIDENCVVFETKALQTTSRYDVWDLYTDIPSEGSDYTPEDLRRSARNLIGWKDACGIRQPM